VLHRGQAAGFKEDIVVLPERDLESDAGQFFPDRNFILRKPDLTVGAASEPPREAEFVQLRTW
jgi:hypothetical protein